MKGNDISAQILGWTNHQGHDYRKKIPNCILGCSVQCRGVLCCDSLLLGGGLSHLGFAHTVAGLPWVRAALATCAGGRAVLLKPGWARDLIADFFFLCIFEMGWKDLKRSAHCYRAWATMSTVTWAPWSPENGTSFPAIKILLPIQVSKWSHVTLYH